MVEETIFGHLEALQQGQPWGRVLDAGTGRHSLRWITQLDTQSWTAVTCGGPYADALRREFRSASRSGDRILSGNWTDPAFLHGEVFDVVLADYLLGAVDRFSPRFQDRLFERLRPHVGQRLYVVGLDPYPETASTPGGELILEVVRLRDACILLGQERCHLEYPAEWAERSLEQAGFVVEDLRRYPIIYRLDFIEGQLSVCRGKLPRIPDRRLARELEIAISRLHEQARTSPEVRAGVRFGTDYSMLARPTRSAPPTSPSILT